MSKLRAFRKLTTAFVFVLALIYGLNVYNENKTASKA